MKFILLLLIIIIVAANLNAATAIYELNKDSKAWDHVVIVIGESAPTERVKILSVLHGPINMTGKIYSFNHEIYTLKEKKKYLLFFSTFNGELSKSMYEDYLLLPIHSGDIEVTSENDPIINDYKLIISCAKIDNPNLRIEFARLLKNTFYDHPLIIQYVLNTESEFVNLSKKSLKESLNEIIYYPDKNSIETIICVDRIIIDNKDLNKEMNWEKSNKRKEIFMNLTKRTEYKNIKTRYVDLVIESLTDNKNKEDADKVKEDENKNDK